MRRDGIGNTAIWKNHQPWINQLQTGTRYRTITGGKEKPFPRRKRCSELSSHDATSARKKRSERTQEKRVYPHNDIATTAVCHAVDHGMQHERWNFYDDHDPKSNNGNGDQRHVEPTLHIPFYIVIL